jgi:hypothetical protein
VKLPKIVHSLFWNYDAEELDTETAKTTIILEVLSRGSLEQIKIIFQIYGKATVGRVFRTDVKENRTLPASVIYLFSALFLSLEEFEEYKAWHKDPVRK